MEEAASAQEEINWKGGKGDGGGRVEGTEGFGARGVEGSLQRCSGTKSPLQK